MKRSNDRDLVTRYKQHRVALLREVLAFDDALASLKERLLGIADEHMGRVAKIATPSRTRKSSGRNEAARLRRRRWDEYLAYLLASDDEAVALQRTWRVLLIPSTAAVRDVEVLDDYFLDPVTTFGEHHVALAQLYPERFLLIDRGAGMKPVHRALYDHLDIRGPREPSRLPSDPPFVLDDPSGAHDFAREDLATVRLCMNGSVPRDFAQKVVAEVYPSLAHRCGYVPGRRRLPPRSPNATEWARFLKVVRRRRGQLAPVLAPLAAPKRDRSRAVAGDSHR